MNLIIDFLKKKYERLESIESSLCLSIDAMEEIEEIFDALAYNIILSNDVYKDLTDARYICENAQKDLDYIHDGLSEADAEARRNWHWNRIEECEKKHETEGPWFSVDDRTPAIDEEVIALDYDGRICLAHMVDKSKAKSYDGWNIPGVCFWREFEPSADIKEYYEQ